MGGARLGRLVRWMVTGVAVLGWAGTAAGGGLNPGELGAHQTRHESSATQEMGRLDWEIVEWTSGTTILSGTRTLRMSDLSVVEDQLDGRTDYDRRLDLGEGFYIKLDSGVESAPPTGFGLAAARRGETTFSWEWFVVENGGRARKLQESGALEIETRRLDGSGWVITRTRFLSDVSLRIFPEPSLLTLVVRFPRWRINIRKGSEIRWPVPENGELVAKD